ncbi:alpha-catulin-like protein [Leptotrombidium deliense]|uniref:Alpha-catulin-like protein n=1 Tax=Leptotrombidium deliense TaxID=299467 RepID=A0A443SPU8_9ACAR|nr:alpha-catulin-like protein [Leptotrombidium deliense]
MNLRFICAENVANFTEFVKAFSQFGSEMVELAHLTGDRQNDLKGERRRAQMAAARQILERSTMMLLTSSKACLRHPDCDTARENRDAVFTQMRRAMNLIHFVVKDGVIPELAAAAASVDTHYSRRNHRQGNYSLYHSGITNRISHVDWRVQDYDQCLTAHNAIKRFEDLVEMSRMSLCGGSYRERLISAFDSLVERTQDFTDSAYTTHEHREKILLLCDRAKLELNQLLRIGVCLDEAGSTAPTEDFEASIVQTIRGSNELKHQLKITALDHADELFKLTDEMDTVNRLKNSALSGDHDRLEEYAEYFSEHSEHVQEVCKLLHNVATNETLQITSKITESSLRVYGPQFLNACHTLCIYPNSKIAKENLEVFIDVWISLYSDVHQLSKEIGELLRGADRFHQLSLPRQSRPPKSVSIQGPSTFIPGSSNPQFKVTPLDTEEQEKIAKTGIEMKNVTSEMDTEAEKWPDSEDNDIVRRAKTMSQLAFLMYQFTRGEGELNTTQDLFTQAEFFAEEANKFYKVVRHFTYQVPSGPLKKELLEHLDKVPTFVQQLQFTVKNSTVGKAATFTKVDNVIQETKNLMTFVTKTVNSCLTCSSTYNLDMGAVRARSRTLSPSGRYGEDDGAYDGGSGMGSKGGTASSDPNI